MARFPKGPTQLAKAGYIYLGDSYCKAEGCGALLHWYKYSVTGQRIPVDSITMGPHWECCAGADKFRKKKKKPEPPPDPQLNMFAPKLMREPGED
jgi:hypothetical protein